MTNNIIDALNNLKLLCIRDGSPSHSLQKSKNNDDDTIYYSITKLIKEIEEVVFELDKGKSMGLFGGSETMPLVSIKKDGVEYYSNRTHDVNGVFILLLCQWVNFISSLIEYQEERYFEPNGRNASLLDLSASALRDLLKQREKCDLRFLRKKKEYLSSLVLNKDQIDRASLLKDWDSKFVKPLISRQINDEVKKSEQLGELLNEKIGYLHSVINNVQTDYSISRSDVDNIIKQAKMKHEAIDSIIEDLSSGKEQAEKIKFLHEDCKRKAEDIKDVFIAASRQGMAGAFNERRQGLLFSSWWWMVVFLISIISLSMLQYDMFDSTNATSSDVREILKHFAVSFPLIWLAFFSAKSYTHSNRLIEDYSYKCAIAMAYEGYKKEAKEHGDLMSMELMSSSLKHFADNPVRLYEKNGDCTSPLTEALEKVKPEQYTDLIKVLIEKIKS